MGQRASGGRWGSIRGVGLCRGRPGSGVRRWADLAGANGSSAIVLGNFGGLGRRGMGQGGAIWGGGGRAQLGLENVGGGGGGSMVGRALLAGNGLGARVEAWGSNL